MFERMTLHALCLIAFSSGCASRPLVPLESNSKLQSLSEALVKLAEFEVSKDTGQSGLLQGIFMEASISPTLGSGYGEFGRTVFVGKSKTKLKLDFVGSTDTVDQASLATVFYQKSYASGYVETWSMEYVWVDNAWIAGTDYEILQISKSNPEEAEKIRALMRQQKNIAPATQN